MKCTSRETPSSHWPGVLSQGSAHSADSGIDFIGKLVYRGVMRRNGMNVKDGVNKWAEREAKAPRCQLHIFHLTEDLT